MGLDLIPFTVSEDQKKNYVCIRPSMTGAICFNQLEIPEVYVKTLCKLEQDNSDGDDSSPSESLEDCEKRKFDRLTADFGNFYSLPLFNFEDSVKKEDTCHRLDYDMLKSLKDTAKKSVPEWASALDNALEIIDNQADPLVTVCSNSTPNATYLMSSTLMKLTSIGSSIGM